jgi:hypothetical protein
VFFEASRTGIPFSSWDYQHNLGIQKQASFFQTSLVTTMNLELQLYFATVAAFESYVFDSNGQSMYNSLFFTSAVNLQSIAQLAQDVKAAKVFVCSPPTNSVLSLANANKFGIYWVELYHARYLNGIIAGIVRLNCT